MSKKQLLATFSILIVFAFLLSGCSLLKKLFPSSTPTGSKTEEKGFSLKDALSLGKSVQCTYTTPEGKMTSWVKGNKVRVEGTGVSQSNDQTSSGGMINDGEWIYIWGGDDQQGIKYQISAVEAKEFEEGVPDWRDINQWAAEVEEKYQVDCQTVVVSDSQFVPPQDIEFQNLTGTFEKMKEVEKSLPSPGTNKGLTKDQIDQLQDLMKQPQE